MGNCVSQGRSSLLFHILQYIAQGSSAKSNHETAQDKTELHFAASCDTVMDIKRLFFPHVFSRALDRNQRNIKMSSSPLTVLTQDNGSHIRQDSLPRPSSTLSKGSCHGAKLILAPWEHQSSPEKPGRAKPVLTGSLSYLSTLSPVQL